MRWTGPQILKQLPKLSVFAASIGTSGTMTGCGLYLKGHRPSCKRLGCVLISFFVKSPEVNADLRLSLQYLHRS